MPADTLPLSTPRRKIAFVINSLGPGGAERVLGNILQMASLEQWEVHLILLDREEEFRVPPEFVEIHRLDCRMKLRPSIAGLKETLGRIKPDLIVSFLVRANVAAILAGRALRTPVIISERSHLTTHLAERHGGLKWVAATAAPRLTYPMADHVIAVSDGVRSDLVARFGVSPKRATSIPNPFDLDRLQRDGAAEPEQALPRRFIVSVGRLVAAKGFDDLLRAYAMANPDLPLLILGQGEERDRLEAQITASGLRDRVRLMGYFKNPFAAVARAEFFVSASHCEGFPNAMAEAMAMGVPVIATDCASGPAEILDEVEAVGAPGLHLARFGMLAPVRRPDALAQGMRAMADATTRARYSQLARQRMEDFRIERITARYWDTFASVLAQRSALKQPARARATEREHA